MLQIESAGQEIISTNYWDTEHAQRGYFFLSINAGAYRLLVPDNRFEMLAEIRTAEFVVLSRGPWPQQNRPDAIEILFEDHTDSPYSLHIIPEQCDRLPGNADANKRRPFTVWHRSGKALELPCFFRMVKSLPWLKPYSRPPA